MPIDSEPSLSTQAYEAIKRDILAAVLKPGERVAQPQLVEKYDVGVTPVREALQRLAQEGFVEPIPRYGYVVTPITPSDIFEIYEIRSMIESGVARLAAERASEEQLEHLGRIAASTGFTYVHTNHQSYAEFLGLNSDFHLAVAAASGNQRAVGLLSALLDELSRVFHLYLDVRDYAAEMREEHLAVARAINDRDPDRAERMAREQVARSFRRVQEAIERNPALSPSSQPLGFEPAHRGSARLLGPSDAIPPARSSQDVAP